MALWHVSATFASWLRLMSARFPLSNNFCSRLNPSNKQLFVSPFYSRFRFWGVCASVRSHADPNDRLVAREFTQIHCVVPMWSQRAVLCPMFETDASLSYWAARGRDGLGNLASFALLQITVSFTSAGCAITKFDDQHTFACLGQIRLPAWMGSDQ